MSNIATPRTLTLAAMLCATALAITGMITHAGPLDPPAGPVASSYKTLTDVEPRIPINATNTPGDATALFKITAKGSYYLTSNLTGASGKCGILITADEVTLDLNGFEVGGVAGATTGILGSGQRSGIAIRNGAVNAWPSGGIFIPTTNSVTRGHHFQQIRCRSNGGTGIFAGDAVTLIACEATTNTGKGFDVGNQGIFDDCIATGNTLDGFDVGFGSTVTGCIARENLGHGFATFGGDGTFTGCSATLNSGDGFHAGRATYHACQASFNTGNGYSIGSGTIQCCGSFNNTGGGIVTGSFSMILDNHIINGAVGIRASGTDNRIESNDCSGATTGYDITGTGNLIIRNSATGGTTRYNIAAGNAAGPVINAANTSSTIIHTANFDY